MQVLHGFGDGVENGAGLSLREELLPEYLVQQFSSFHQLRYQVHGAAVVINLLAQPHTSRGGGRQHLSVSLCRTEVTEPDMGTPVIIGNS